MASQVKPFSPDWRSPPGETIADVIEERGLKPDEVAAKLGLEPADFGALLAGDAPMTQGLAEILAEVLGSTPGFWMRREAHREPVLPAWFPENPYPEWAFPMTGAQYVKAVPDPKLRTAISGCIGRWVFEATARRVLAALEDRESEIKIPIGARDKLGVEIHLGDELEFDSDEWYRRGPAGPGGDPVRFRVELKDGDLSYYGDGRSDFSEWCEVVDSPGLNPEDGS